MEGSVCGMDRWRKQTRLNNKTLKLKTVLFVRRSEAFKQFLMKWNLICYWRLIFNNTDYLCLSNAVILIPADRDLRDVNGSESYDGIKVIGCNLQQSALVKESRPIET